MKTIKIFLLTISLCTFLNSNGQTKNKNIIKVNYSTGATSLFMSEMLKKQIQDPTELNKMLNKINGYKIYSSLYQNLKTKESVYILDSIKKVDKINIAGNTYYVYKNKEGVIQGKELFMGKDINFKATLKNLKWIITEEQKNINGYQCKMAKLKSNPKVTVWFTPEVPVSSGPYMFYGLPGLILEVDNYFEVINALTISYENEEIFKTKLEEIKQKMADDEVKAIPIEEVFIKKENFQKMIIKGK